MMTEKDLKDKMDLVLKNHNGFISDSFSDNGDLSRMENNYDLYYNRVNNETFKFLTNPIGDFGELPAKFNHIDISSVKINYLIGLSAKKRFDWNLAAVNHSASTRKEEKKYNDIKESVINDIMLPLKQDKQREAEEIILKRGLTDDEAKKVNDEVMSSIKDPISVRRYYEEEYQDPAEIQGAQLINYLELREELSNKFFEGFKDLMIAGKSIFWIHIENGEPKVKVVSPLRFSYGSSDGSTDIQDSSWACQELYLTTSEFINIVSQDLSNKKIKKIIKDNTYNVSESFFNGSSRNYINRDDLILVYHATWIGHREVKFITNEKGIIKIVSSDYVESENEEVEIVLIPEVYEGYKVNDEYFRVGIAPGHIKDLDSVHDVKLPYYGIELKSNNGEIVSPTDRLKNFQFYYNVINYRLELLLAANKGKKVLMSINTKPKDVGMSLTQWQHLFEATPFLWYDDSEEGYQDASTTAKVLDLSLSQDISTYLNLLKYIKSEAGGIIGVSESVEGRIGSNEAVGNTQQTLIQTSYITEPYYFAFARLKLKILKALLDMSIVTYSVENKEKLIYIIDDMSNKMLELNIDLLDSTTYGLFFIDGKDIEGVEEALRQYTHAAMQNDSIKIKEAVDILGNDSLPEIKAILSAAEKQREEAQQQAAQTAMTQLRAEKELEFEFEEKSNGLEIKLAEAKEDAKRETEIAKSLILASSFNPDKDSNNNGKNDFIEAADNVLGANIKLDIEKRKMDLAERTQKEKNEIELKKLSKKT